MKFFNQIKKIKTKLLLQSGILLGLTLVLGITTVISIVRIIYFTDVRKLTTDTKIFLLQMRRSEKDYVLRDLINADYFQNGQSQYVSKFSEFARLAEGNLKKLETESLIKDLDLTDSIAEVRKYLSEYNTYFLEEVSIYKQKGFKDWGMEGELRKAAHELENDSTMDKIFLLTLRRHEKDYLLRHDVQYFEKIKEEVESFKSENPEEANEKKLLTEYVSTLSQIIELDKKLGFTDDDGIKRRLRIAVHKIDPIIDLATEKIVIHVEAEKNRLLILIIILTLGQLVVGAILSLAFSKNITQGIKSIQLRIEKLANGVFPEIENLESRDEMGQASKALNNLIGRIETAADFAKKIGEGELNTNYNQEYADDVLAKSLIAMHTKLNEAHVDNEKRNWVTTGLANFSEILRSSSLSLHELSDKIIASLVKYTNANQGQLLIVQNENTPTEHLQLMATYAWGRKKFGEKQIEKGEGLAGQVWIEKETTFLTRIPESYVKITSGLGEASPTSVLIVPMKQNETVFGIIELASFQVYEKYQIDFVEKLAEVIAATLSSVKIATHTKLLLEESQHQAEELRAQEEEMRQNQEEMSATQEEMHRQRTEMEEKILSLERELTKYKEAESDTKKSIKNGATAQLSA
jgi:methyl-accepting chemotaxis protein